MDTINENIIKDVIFNNSNDYDSIPEFYDEFTKLGFIYESIDLDQEIQSHSTDVNWYNRFKVIKDNQEYYVSINGTAIADISYERWVGTYGFVIDDESFYIDKKDIEDNSLDL